MIQPYLVVNAQREPLLEAAMWSRGPLIATAASWPSENTCERQLETLDQLNFYQQKKVFDISLQKAVVVNRDMDPSEDTERKTGETEICVTWATPKLGSLVTGWPTSTLL